MTDTEIDRRLALAIGYRPEDVMVVRATGQIVVDYYGIWSLFSHLRWDVVGPIAERYNCFAYKFPNAAASLKWMWAAHTFNERGNIRRFFAPTPQRAIALAAIAKLERV